MRRLISRDVLRVATRKSWVLILRIRPDHLFGVGTIYPARTFCQQFFWKCFFGGAIKTGSSPVVTEPRAVATGRLSYADFFNKQRAGRYRSRFCNDRVAPPPADSHF